MEEDSVDSKVGGDRQWEWIPNERYGPFIFGMPRAQVPYLDDEDEEDRTDMGSGDVATSYSTTIEGVKDVGFWNDILTGVTEEGDFWFRGRQLIGEFYRDVEGIFVGITPEIDDLVMHVCVDFDDLSLMLWVHEDGRIDSVSVGVDPDDVLPRG